MAELPLYTKEGKSAGTVAVDEKLFGDKVKKRLLHQVVVIHEANQRQGTASTKTRGEVEGSNRKPWPQKHTGRARAGSIRSPIWRHGGIVHGPRPHDHRLTATASMRRTALDSALLAKILDKEVGVIEGFEMKPPKLTHQMAAILKSIGYARSILIGTDQKDRSTVLSARNLSKVKLVPVAEFNAYDVLKHKNVLLTKGALEALVAARKTS
ncbi:MAG: 50S ribosomal protein L4 [Planctomycetes bacterium]|nr:50S ribosomal protein L4 [Planctomycetota bacterium]